MCIRDRPWGNSPDYSRANVYSHGLTPVDAFPQGVSPTGCMDMCGNCWEMVDEFHFDGSHDVQLLRGGSFYPVSYTQLDVYKRQGVSPPSLPTSSPQLRTGPAAWVWASSSPMGRPPFS